MILLVKLMWLLVGLSVGVLAHELGHYAAGRIVGLKAYEVCIGRGAIVSQKCWRGVWFVLRAFPFSGGHVLRFPSLSPTWRSQKFVSVLGGPLATTALLVVALFGAVILEGRLGMQNPLGALAYAQVILLCGTLYPFEDEDGYSDGRQLWMLLRNESPSLEDQYAEVVAAYAPPGASPHTPSAASMRLLLQLGRDRDDRKLDDPAGPFIALEREVERGELTATEEALALDSLVTRALLSQRSAEFPRLLEWAERAVSLAPTINTVRASHASALIELGRCKEGANALAELSFGDDLYSNFLGKVFLARARIGLGDSVAAHGLLDEARKILPSATQGVAGASGAGRLFAETEMALVKIANGDQPNAPASLS